MAKSTNDQRHNAICPCKPTTRESQHERRINNLKNCAEGIRNVKEIILYIPPTHESIFPLIPAPESCCEMRHGPKLPSCCYWLLFGDLLRFSVFTLKEEERKTMKKNVCIRSWLLVA